MNQQSPLIMDIKSWKAKIICYGLKFCQFLKIRAL